MSSKHPNEIVETLIRRDGMTREEAEKALRDARSRFDPAYDDLSDFLLCEFGLEEDYIFDFLA